ncbi:hypothetical protein KCU91_g10, partial [Aureobasidium melanogenum]
MIILTSSNSSLPSGETSPSPVLLPLRLEFMGYQWSTPSLEVDHYQLFLFWYKASRHSTRLTFHVLASIPLEVGKNHYPTSGDPHIAGLYLSEAADTVSWQAPSGAALNTNQAPSGIAALSLELRAAARVG